MNDQQTLKKINKTRRTTLLKILKWVALASFLLLGVSCAKIIEKTLENNPEILHKAIKKNPAGFMATLREAAQEAQKADIENARKQEQDDRKKEFENPKSFALEADRPVKGNRKAPVVIVEYSDLQCPFCSRGSNTMGEVAKAYGDKVSFVFKHLPLEGKHPNARRGSEYFEAIAMHDVNKAFKFKELVFVNQKETYGAKSAVEKLYAKLTKEAGADVGKVQATLKSKKSVIAARIDKDIQEAQKNGIQGTPGFLINGVTLKGAYPFDEFKKIIDEWLKRKG